MEFGSQECYIVPQESNALDKFMSEYLSDDSVNLDEEKKTSNKREALPNEVFYQNRYFSDSDEVNIIHVYILLCPCGCKLTSSFLL